MSPHQNIRSPTPLPAIYSRQSSPASALSSRVMVPPINNNIAITITMHHLSTCMNAAIATNQEELQVAVEEVPKAPVVDIEALKGNSGLSPPSHNCWLLRISIASGPLTT
jgi:hypothetical protein